MNTEKSKQRMTNFSLAKSILVIILLWVGTGQLLLAAETETLEEAKALALQSGQPILIEFFRDG